MCTNTSGSNVAGARSEEVGQLASQTPTTTLILVFAQ